MDKIAEWKYFFHGVNNLCLMTHFFPQGIQFVPINIIELNSNTLVSLKDFNRTEFKVLHI